MAGSEGFEPPNAFTFLVFKTSAFTQTRPTAQMVEKERVALPEPYDN